MRRTLLTLIVATLIIAGWVWSQATAQTRPAATPTTQPASATTQKAAGDLLLLEDDPAGADDKSQALNSRCLVCHMNFAKEELSAKHAAADVGCAKCHGASDAHIADESWASGGKGTAPDIMYLPEKINAACLSCHDARFDRKQHKAFITGQTPQKYCTQCHGQHRMANRKCKWK